MAPPASTRISARLTRVQGPSQFTRERVQAGGELTAVKIFTSLALFEILQWPLQMLPMVLFMFITAKVAIGPCA